MTKVRAEFDDKPIPGKNADPAFSELRYDGGGDGDTALSLTNPSTATKMAGMAEGETNVDGTTAASAQHDIERTGKRRVRFDVSEITPVNNQVITLAVYKNNTITNIRAKFTQPATGVAIPSIGMEGLLDCVKGDTLDLRVTASTGNFSWKRARFLQVEV
jgi:hypothetical protein